MLNKKSRQLPKKYTTPILTPVFLFFFFFFTFPPILPLSPSPFFLSAFPRFKQPIASFPTPPHHFSHFKTQPKKKLNI